MRPGPTRRGALRQWGVSPESCYHSRRQREERVILAQVPRSPACRMNSGDVSPAAHKGIEPLKALTVQVVLNATFVAGGGPQPLRANKLKRANEYKGIFGGEGARRQKCSFVTHKSLRSIINDNRRSVDSRLLFHRASEGRRAPGGESPDVVCSQNARHDTPSSHTARTPQDCLSLVARATTSLRLRTQKYGGLA